MKTDLGMRARAERLGAELQREDGAGTAATVIQACKPT